jgi:Domain of unknown function (DUF4148)
MKALMCAVFAATVVAVPSLASAQTSNQVTNGPVTRAEVRADLVQLEQAGYHPEKDDPYYPANVQAAEARIHAVPGADESYGGVENSSAVGAGVPTVPMSAVPIENHTLYSGH